MLLQKMSCRLASKEVGWQSVKQKSMETNRSTFRNCKVYLLVEVESCKIFYVGASRNLKERLANHIARAKRGDSKPVSKHIREILLKGGKVEIRGWMGGLTLAEASKVEGEVIRAFGLDNLTNVLPYSTGLHEYKYERKEVRESIESEGN